MASLTQVWKERLEDIKVSLEHSLQNGDPRTQDWLLVYSPWPVLCLCVLYIVMCYVGPKMMANRQPFQLKGVLIIYNFFMVLLSLYMLKEFYLSSSALNYSYLCAPLEYSTDEWSMRLAAVIWLYFFSKIIEFLDTFFFILRKKNNQISFLHVYHHVSMFILWWLSTKWFAGGIAFFPPMINCFVHIIMYAYYMLSACGESLRKYLWWKRYVTVLQMVQFFVVIAQNLNAIYIDCDYDKRALWVCVVFLSSLFILFMNFFVRSYVKGSTRHQENGNLYSRTVGVNGHLQYQHGSAQTTKKDN